MKNARRYYEHNDTSVLPRAIASFDAFENAVALDIAMGGSTNTVLHLLAAAHEAGVDFTMKDIDRMSRRVPHLSKVAPSIQTYHMEDVHRAGGVMAILGELERGGLVHRDLPTVLCKSMGEQIDTYDIRRTTDKDVKDYFRAAPGGVPTQTAFSQNRRFAKLDDDRVNGCLHDIEHAYSKDGGLAVLYGNLAADGCIVKTAGVDESIWTFSGPARVFESQDAAVEAILGDKIVAGDVVVILYEGPRGGPGMQEMLYPTSYLKSKGLGKVCALITDGRFSGGTSGLSIGHASPEAAEGGTIGLVQEGDIIEIDIPKRSINVALSDAELDAPSRRHGCEGRPRLEAGQPGAGGVARAACLCRDGDLCRVRRRARRQPGRAPERSADACRPAVTFCHSRPAELPRRCRRPDLCRHRQPRRPRDHLSAGRARGELPSQVAAGAGGVGVRCRQVRAGQIDPWRRAGVLAVVWRACQRSRRSPRTALPAPCRGR